jgi:hypothetical protein
MDKNRLKFKKLLNEYRSVFYELEYVSQIVREVNLEFDEFKKSYCQRKQICTSTLNNRYAERIKSIFSSSAITKTSEVMKKENEYDPKKIFRQIARKFHPDTLDSNDPRFDEFESVFKKASAAIDDNSWGDLFDIAERYDLELEDFDTINKLLEDHIALIKEQVEHKKNTYSWLFYCCDTDEEKNELIRKFLEHMYVTW